jgi:hypothetical protein
MSTLGLMAATGWALDKNGKPQFVNVDMNKDSRTFGEVSVGGFRWNYWGADAPLVRYALAVSQGKQQIAAGGPAVSADRRRISENFAGAKIAPGVPRALWVQLVNDGYDPYSQREVNTKSGALLFAIDQVDPLFFANTFEAYQDLGPAAVAPAFIANQLGATTATYNLEPTEKQAERMQSIESSKALTEAGYVTSDAYYQREKPAFVRSFGPEAEKYDDISGLKTAWVDQYLAGWMKKNGLPEPAARADLQREFEKLPIVEEFKEKLKQAETNFIRRNPKAAYEAWAAGELELDQEQQKILENAR